MKHSLLLRRSGAVLMASAVLLTSAAVLPVMTENTGIEVQAADQSGYEKIYTIDDLYNIGSNPTGKYILMNDIDLSETAPGGEWDFGNGWAGIPFFDGELDGNGHEIRNMHIFGNVSNAGFIIRNTGLIKDLRFTDVDVNITSSCNFGTICCCYELDKTYGKISNCSVSGAIRVESQGSCSVGGLVCYTRPLSQRSIRGRIVNSYNLADITVNSSEGAIGGIIGHLNSSKSGKSEETFYTSYVISCYNKGNITGNGDFSAGGIVGTDMGGICGCINFKDGGIYGKIGEVKFNVSTENTFYEKYNMTTNTTTTSRGASKNICEKLIEQCYCLKNNTFGNGGTGLAAKQMTTAGAYSGLDFDDVWVSTSTGPQLKNNPEISAESIEIAQMPEKLNYKIGDDIQAGGTITVTYSNGNTNTVNITKDMLSGYDMTQGGVQDVTVTYQGCQTTYEITVSSTPVTSVSISDSEIYLATGEIYKLTASILPENATNKTLKWTTSDSSVAAVTSDGKVTAVGSGLAVITVKSNNNKSASCIVNVDWSDDEDIDPSAVSLNKTSLTLEKGKSETLTASILPKNATNTSITWRSSNAKIAAVTNGKVTAVAAGTTTVLAITSNGLTASCTVTVTEPVPVSTLNNTSVINSDKVQIGDKVRIAAAGNNGTAPYTYAYYYKRSTNAAWKTLGTEWGTNSSVAFAPTAEASYDIKVVVKDSTGATAEKLFTVTAVKELELTNVSVVGREKIKLGSAIPMIGKAVGGAGEPYTYSFYFKRSTNTAWKLLGNKFTATASARFKPTATGTYDIRIDVKDSTGTVVKKLFTATVK